MRPPVYTRGVCHVRFVVSVIVNSNAVSKDNGHQVYPTGSTPNVLQEDAVLNPNDPTEVAPNP
jgi:hypothetical protein